MTTIPTVVEAIEELRNKYGWSKSRMAQELGIQKSNYSEILAGRRRLPLEATKRAYFLGVPAKILLQKD